MNLPKFLLYPLGFLVLSTGIVWAGQMTLTSYYPSPSGNYNLLTANSLTVNGAETVTGALTGANITATGLTVNGAETVTGNLQVNGAITSSGCISTSAASCSDRRLKQNILPLTGTLSKLDQLRGVSFEWNHLATTLGLKEGQKSIGMIAQELQKVYPELVVATKSGHQEYLSIDYGKFTVVLLQSIKELKGQMNTMQDQINALQKRK